MRPILFATTLTLTALLFMVSCSTNDSCENTICLNNGICTNGLCDCPDRFTGPNCQDQIAPDKIHLLAISVTRFPALRNDMPWDGTDGPDIYFRLYDEQGPLTQPLTLIENANPGMAHMFSIRTLDLFNISQVYTLKLLDYEGAGVLSEDMGEIQFQIYKDDNGFPENLVVDDGGPLAFTLNIGYMYTSSSSGGGS